MQEGVDIGNINIQTADARSYRLSNIDMVRGLVIIIMAIDHVRDFFYMVGVQDPMEQPDISVGIYFMRWITHFCAPVFVLLAGTSIGLMSARKTQYELAAFVFKRGIWLMFLEFFVVSTAFSFTPFGEPLAGGTISVALQVIWALGVSMVVLSGVLFLGARICLFLGAVIIAGHNLLDAIWPLTTQMAEITSLGAAIHSMGIYEIGPYLLFITYPVLPWIGVILFGYGIAYIFEKEAISRDKLLIKSGLISIAVFIILRFLDIYGEPNSWENQQLGLLATFFDFMNVSKYPPSFLFLLVTLGPMAILCGLADKWTGWLKDTLVMFGRVPLAFYVVHLYLIHLLSILFGMMQGFEAHEMVHFFVFYPEGYGTGLTGVYLVWILVLVLLYPFCKWFAGVKRTRKDWWLSYL